MQAPQGLGISFLPSPLLPSSPPSPVPEQDEPNRALSVHRRRRESNPAQSTKQPLAQFPTLYHDNLAGARGLELNRRRSVSYSTQPVSSPDSFGIGGGIRVENRGGAKAQNGLHTLSPLSDFDTGSSSDDHSFSPASLSSLPSSTNSEAAYYPQYHQAQRVQLQHRPYHIEQHTPPSNIHEIFPRIPLPQPPRIETSSPQRSSQHTDGARSPEMLSPNSRLPAFIRDRTIQRDALSRPKSMLELGSLAADTFGTPSSTTLPYAHTADGEEQDEDDGGNWLNRNESIASSAGGHARQQLQLRRHLAKPISHSRSRSAGNMPTQADESDLPYRQDNALARSGALSIRGKHGSQAFEGEGANGRVAGEGVEDLQRTLRDKRMSTVSTIVDEEESTAARLNRNATLLTIGASPLRRGKELDRILAPTSARKVLSSLPSSSSIAASTPNSHLRTHSRNSSLASMQIPISVVSGPVILEQAKSTNKARVEVDLSLSSSVLVEGGAMKGRIELNIRRAKENEKDVWIGRPKVRVVGFEELSTGDDRHIFYHHAASIVNYDNAGQIERLAYHESTPDLEGYSKGKFGQHSVPFSVVLPIGKGAKGGWKGKQGIVRYIVIASVKLKSMDGTDRSIAHFYRHIELYPYLNPAIILAPAMKALEASTSKTLFMGGTGLVKLVASIHRSTWVAGQSCYVNVRVENDSTKKIKTLNLSLIRTTSVYRFAPTTAQAALEVNSEADASQTQMTKKKVTETTLEMGKKGNSGVTAKGIWLGVDKGEALDFSHFLLVPAESLSIARGRYLEISYAVKISVQASLSADVSVEIPIKVISFISIDPPPGHCADPTPTSTPRIISHGRTKSWNIDQIREPREEERMERPPMTIADLVDRPEPGLTRMGSLDTIRTSNISQSSHLDANLRSPDHRSRVAGGGAGGEQKLQHRMSLDCISEAIASATARGHRRSASGLRAEISLQSDAEPEGRNYTGAQMGDEEVDVESEDELDAVMRQARFDEDEEEEEPAPFDNSTDLINRPPTSPLRRLPLPSSPVKPTIVEAPTSPSKGPPEAKKSKRSESFGYATPGSPIKSSSPKKSPIKASVPLPATPTIRRAISRVELRAASPVPTSTTARPLPTRPIVAKVSIASLSTATTPTASSTNKTLEKKSSMKSLRPSSSLANLKTRPSSAMSIHSPASTSSSSRRTPDLEFDSPSSFARIAPSVSANIARHTRTPSYTETTTSSSRHALPPLPLRRKPTESVLPSVRNKVRALETRQDALMRLRSVDASEVGGRDEGLRRADSVRTEMSFSLGDELVRNGSLMSFKAPMLRQHD